MIPVEIKHPDVVVWKGYESEALGTIQDLHAVRDTETGTIWSKWEPESFLERLAVLFGASIWLGVNTKILPPVSLVIHKGKFFSEER